MAMQFTDELQAEAPPSKRVRLECSEDMQGTMDIKEDNYRTVENGPAIEASKTSHIEIQKTAAAESSTLNMKGIPGLGLLGQALGHERKSTPGGRQYDSLSNKFTKLMKLLLQIMKKIELPLIQFTMYTVRQTIWSNQPKIMNIQSRRVKSTRPNHHKCWIQTQ